MTPDRIELRALRVLGHHGALPGEQDHAQPFEVDLDLEVDLAQAEATDELSATVDYGAVVSAVRRVVEQRRFNLLEALAGAVASSVLELPGIEAVTVTVRKLRPPVEADLASSGVRLRRVSGGPSPA